MALNLLARGSRFVVVMVLCSIVTALVLLAAIPHLTQTATVVGSVTVALIVALYDFGLFSDDFKL